MSNAMDVSAAGATHVAACVDLRDVAKRMGTGFVERLEAANEVESERQRWIA